MLKKDISLLTDDELLDIIFNSSENIGINYLKELKKRSNIKYYNLFANNQDKIASYFNKIKDSGVKGEMMYEYIDCQSEYEEEILIDNFKSICYMSSIVKILGNKKISRDFKIKLINKKINSDNICTILSYPLDDEYVDYIINNKFKTLLFYLVEYRFDFYIQYYQYEKIRKKVKTDIVTIGYIKKINIDKLKEKINNKYRYESDQVIDNYIRLICDYNPKVFHKYISSLTKEDMYKIITDKNYGSVLKQKILTSVNKNTKDYLFERIKYTNIPMLNLKLISLLNNIEEYNTLYQELSIDKIIELLSEYDKDFMDTYIEIYKYSKDKISYYNKCLLLDNAYDDTIFEAIDFVDSEFIKKYILDNLEKTLKSNTSSNYQVNSRVNTKRFLYKNYYKEYFKNLTQTEIISLLKKKNIPKELIYSYLDENNVPEELHRLFLGIIRNNITNDETIEMYIKMIDSIEDFNEFKKTLIINELNLINNTITYNIKYFIDYYKEDFLDCLKEIDKEKLFYIISSNYDKLSSYAINLLNIPLIYQDIVLKLLKYKYNVNLVINFNEIIDLVNSANIDEEKFIQYGFGDANLIENGLFRIIKTNNMNYFLKIKDMLFERYYNNTDEISIIINFIDLTNMYATYKNLFNNIIDNNIELTEDIICSLEFLNNIYIYRKELIPNNVEELLNFKNTYLKTLKEDILNDNYLYIFNEDKIYMSLINIEGINPFDEIGGIGEIKRIYENTNSFETKKIAEELLTSYKVITLLETSQEDIKEYLLKYIDSKKDDIDNMFSNLKHIREQIRRLFELDSQENLTTLDEARKIEGIYKEDYIKKYGGEVFDFSNKNYCLYAHVLSYREKIEDLINGISTGESNFISLSPISYSGQTYYYDLKNNIIFAYDKIKDGSFIMSSSENMGSNFLIQNNSHKVKRFKRNQRGIINTSKAYFNNAEALLYREGIKPCGIILVGGREPSLEEITLHDLYNLPFIITQNNKERIDNVEYVFHKQNKNNKDYKKVQLIPKFFYNTKHDDIHTGREIAIFTDIHAMFEPLQSVIEDISKREINEIYSLGDDVGIGPNPNDVMQTLQNNHVNRIFGNHEQYLRLGIKYFTYLTQNAEEDVYWTKNQIDNIEQILEFYAPTRDILIGDKLIGLCHFANDVRFDFNNSTWLYQSNANNGDKDACRQFLYTNSSQYYDYIKKNIDSKLLGDIKNYPMFDGKFVTDYDAIIQGHVHFPYVDKYGNTDFYTLPALSMTNDNLAHYIILKERKDGSFDIENRNVPYDKNSLVSSINNSTSPEKTRALRYIHQ